MKGREVKGYMAMQNKVGTTSVNVAGFEKFKNALLKQKKQQVKARARVEKDNERVSRLALLPVLEWFNEHAENEETRIAARLALESWHEPANRVTWLQWSLDSGYINMVERVMLNPAGFKKLLRIAPQTVIEARMNGWVLEAVKLLSKGGGVSKKKVSNPQITHQTSARRSQKQAH